MFLRNLKLYHLTKPLPHTLDEALFHEIPFRHCGAQELQTTGWDSPAPGGEMLTHCAGGFTVMKLKTEKKVVPTQALNQRLQDRIDAIERETGAPVSKKARQDLKQEILHEMLGKAFAVSSATYGIYMPASRLIAVEASGDSRAEVFLAYLRKTIGSLPVVPLANRSLAHDLTSWVQDHANLPETFELLEQVKMQSLDEEKSKAAWQNQPLDSDEVHKALESGKLVKELSVQWDETLTCSIKDDLTIKGIKFSDVIKEQNEDIPKDQALAKWDADIVLCAGELQRFSEALIQEFELYWDSVE